MDTEDRVDLPYVYTTVKDWDTFKVGQKVVVDGEVRKLTRITLWGTHVMFETSGKHGRLSLNSTKHTHYEAPMGADLLSFI